MDKKGRVVVESDGKEARLVLSKNGFIFRIEFLYALPDKKPEWVSVIASEGKENKFNYDELLVDHKTKGERIMRLCH